MKKYLLILILFFCFFNVFAQQQYRPGGRDDSEAARQYVEWIQKAVNEKRWDDAQAAILRAWAFANVSSDISYLFAVIHSRSAGERDKMADVLDFAIQTNRWTSYSENHALLLKAELLVIMRKYNYALNCLDQIDNADTMRTSSPANAQMRADSAMLRLLALRGMGDIQSLALFRSQVLITMDRFPRDSRPLKIFFEYAKNRRPEPLELPEGDIELLELALRRLPFLLEIDPELSWMAAPFIRDLEESRRLAASYRSGSMVNIENFKPHKASIPVALNLGLIDDFTAVEELFDNEEDDSLEKDILINVYNLLRNEEGRDFFTQKLHSFSGYIIWDEDKAGFIDTFVFYESGLIKSLSHDMHQNNFFNFSIEFNLEGAPVSAKYYITGQLSPAQITWERYPFVLQAEMGNEIFKFGPADFMYAPVSFAEIGGSRTKIGLLYPQFSDQYITLTRRALLSFCSSVSRPSQEIDGAVETIYKNRGVILQAVENLNGRQVSITEFERGMPVIQHIDLDLDGRMETIRRFRNVQDSSWQETLNFRSLISSSESDWSGDGRHRTMEVYQLDGSVVYYFDMDGSGEMIYSETGNQR
ncbi:MAG: hypothetical protein FWD14_03090 [Treponema sp.]|nr:hypothetical protein [Treponema sp.]